MAWFLRFLSEWRDFLSPPCLAGKKNLMTARVSMLLKSRASLTCFRACFLPGRAKDLSAPGKLHRLLVCYVVGGLRICVPNRRWRRCNVTQIPLELNYCKNVVNTISGILEWNERRTAPLPLSVIASQFVCSFAYRCDATQKRSSVVATENLQ